MYQHKDELKLIEFIPNETKEKTFGNGRYSLRNRIPKLNHFFGEKIVYKRDSNGETLSSIFSSRESILNWAEKVLGSVNLTEKEKESIFHRFSMCFDLVMDKLFIERQSITIEDDLKKMTITIFLLTYKFEICVFLR